MIVVKYHLKITGSGVGSVDGGPGNAYARSSSIGKGDLCAVCLSVLLSIYLNLARENKEEINKQGRSRGEEIL